VKRCSAVNDNEQRPSVHSTQLLMHDNSLRNTTKCLQMLEQGDIALAIDPDEDDEDAEDDEIRVTDSLLVVAITEDEYSHLEVGYEGS
jgi:hypothetical protein